MKNLYEITNKDGIHLCYQVAETEELAITFARMYGVRGATFAKFIRADA